MQDVGCHDSAVGVPDEDESINVMVLKNLLEMQYEVWSRQDVGLCQPHADGKNLKGEYGAGWWERGEKRDIGVKADADAVEEDYRKCGQRRCGKTLRTTIPVAQLIGWRLSSETFG